MPIEVETILKWEIWADRRVAGPALTWEGGRLA